LGHLAIIEKGLGYTGFWWGNQRERGHLGKPRAHGHIILRWIFRKWEVVYGLDWSGSEQGQVLGTC